MRERGLPRNMDDVVVAMTVGIRLRTANRWAKPGLPVEKAGR